MSAPKFIQIHTLHSYPASLLNRDDNGLAKIMPYGGVTRTRISSQCLKRHWRMANDEYALSAIDGAEDAIRSRNVVGRKVMKPLRDEGTIADDVLDAVEKAFTKGVYGDRAEAGDDKAKTRQPLLLGLPEIEYLCLKAQEICAEHPDDAKAAGAAAELLFTASKKNEERDNFIAFRERTCLPGGLIAALFGRMVTSDPGANIIAPIHVSQAITVHAKEAEYDYFSVYDDLQYEDEDGGSAHLGNTELNAGIFYGYIVVDVQGLVDNLSGSSELAGKVVKHLIHLIATVSPGAKLGATAPYSYADLMLIEAGNRQPRSLVDAYREPVTPQIKDAVVSMNKRLAELDACYGIHEERRVMSIGSHDMSGALPIGFDDIAEWASSLIHEGEV